MAQTINRKPPPPATIAACATVLRPAERAIVRLSGPAAVTCAAAVFQPFAGALTASSLRPGVVAGQFTLTLAGRPTPVEGYLLVFRGPKSYTGEDLIECHLPGAPVVVAALLQALYAAGARAAEPGEFTRRAVLQGRMNLVEAQATLVAIHGQDAADLRVGARLLGGETQAALGHIRGQLLDLLADIEAGLDFSGEDIEIVGDTAVIERLAAIGAALEQEHRLLDPRGAAGRRELSGLLPRVALIGPTGGGKSTLFNRLGAVSPTSGASGAAAGLPGSLIGPAGGGAHTTRDVLTQEWQLGAARAVAGDLPGVGATAAEETLEREAIAAGLRFARSADILVVVVDGSGPPPVAVDWTAALQALEYERDPRPAAWVLNKSDRPQSAAVLSPPAVWARLPQFAISAQTGAGLAALGGWLEKTVQELATPAASIGDLLIHLQAAATAVMQAQTAVTEGQELAALAIREALVELERSLHQRLSADQRTEAMLDRLFARFCLGK